MYLSPAPGLVTQAPSFAPEETQIATDAGASPDGMGVLVVDSSNTVKQEGCAECDAILGRAPAKAPAPPPAPRNRKQRRTQAALKRCKTKPGKRRK